MNSTEELDTILLDDLHSIEPNQSTIQSSITKAAVPVENVDPDPEQEPNPLAALLQSKLKSIGGIGGRNQAKNDKTNLSQNDSL